MSVVSRETREDVQTVLRFLGVNEDSVIHLFRRAADTSADAFATTMRAMAEAVKEDERHGTTARIRRIIERERAARGKK